MTTIAEYQEYGEEIERLLLLRTSPIAVKMLQKEEDIPEGAYRPKRDDGVHLAQCQAFTMSRRKRKTVAMLKEDNWCFAPIIGWGLVEKPDPEQVMGAIFPCFDYGKYIGIVTAPLKTADFMPDMILVYSNPMQLRLMMGASQTREERILTSEFYSIDSCIYSIVPVMETGKCRITLPDPGEYERAMTTEDEIIFSVPADTVGRMVEGLKRTDERKRGYIYSTMDMTPDFPRPEFYKKLFEMWGLDV
ncbi:DUF169 domain-containing protein [Chloroflexota bacterium]